MFPFIPGVPMAALVAIFGKVKGAKILLAMFSMLVATAGFALVLGWPYGIGLILLLLAHEMGHFLAARQRSLNPSPPYFIPFIGAFVAIKDLQRDAETEAYVSIAGPLAGTLVTLALWFFGRAHHEPLILALAYASAAINLFNLIPIYPLDGGRIIGAINPLLWLLSVPLLVALAVLTKDIFYLILLASMLDTLRHVIPEHLAKRIAAKLEEKGLAYGIPTLVGLGFLSLILIPFNSTLSAILGGSGVALFALGTSFVNSVNNPPVNPASKKYLERIRLTGQASSHYLFTYVLLAGILAAVSIDLHDQIDLFAPHLKK